MTDLLKHPIIIGIISVLVVFYYVSLDKSAQKVSVSEETVQKMQEEVAVLASDVSILEKQLEAANHPLAQEKVIRNDLLMQKPGEYVLQLPNIEVQEQVVEKAEEKTPWQEWKEILL